MVPTAQIIRVIVVDDVSSTLEDVTRLISFDREIEVIGTARNGFEALELARALRPDIVLMDVNMPEMDGVQAAGAISSELPGVAVVMMSVQSEADYLRSAMSAGARDYLVKPFSPDDAVATIKRAHRLEADRSHLVSQTSGGPKGRVVAVFSGKGGVGKTTVSVNLAASLAGAGQSVTLVDLDLQFGDVAMMLDMVPRRSIVDVSMVGDAVDFSTLTSCLDSYHGARMKKPIRTLAAPSRPEQAEYVKPVHVEACLRLLRELSPVTVVDTCHTLDDVTLSVLDQADDIVMITTPELPTIKNVRLSLDLMSGLGYRTEGIHLVVNRADSDGSISIKEVEKAVGMRVCATIPRDERLAITAANRGVPFVISNPRAEISLAMGRLASYLIPGQEPATAKSAPDKQAMGIGNLIGNIRRPKAVRE